MQTPAVDRGRREVCMESWGSTEGTMCPIICEWGMALPRRGTGRAVQGKSIYKVLEACKTTLCPTSCTDVLGFQGGGSWSGKKEMAMKWHIGALWGDACMWEVSHRRRLCTRDRLRLYSEGKEGRGTPRREGDRGEASVSRWCHSVALWGVWVREVQGQQQPGLS